MMTLQELNALLDSLEQDPNGKGEFIGHHTSNAVRHAKYPLVWQQLIERYIQLVGSCKTTANVLVYCDMACTVVTKKIMMIDIFYLYDLPTDEHSELREAHIKTATLYLAKMLTCIYECVHGRMPDKAAMMNAASLLYAEVYSEAFDIETVQEREVFRLVKKLFINHVLVDEKTVNVSFQNVAVGIPFLFCSHVYWLWLHLTAARAIHSARDLLTVIYALDMIVYCGECTKHFLELRSEFFSDHPDGKTECSCTRFNNCELLFHLHNRVNAQTGSPQMDVAVLSEYEGFWER